SVSVHTDLLVYLVKEQSLRRCGHRVRAAYFTEPFFSVKPFFIWFRVGDDFIFTPLKPRLLANY
ncbi:hypothetical protein, partial [Shewanella carassii]